MSGRVTLLNNFRVGEPNSELCEEFGQLVRLGLVRQGRIKRRRRVTEQPRMSVLAELAGKKRHERRAAIVNLGYHQAGRAAREDRRVVPCRYPLKTACE